MNRHNPKHLLCALVVALLLAGCGPQSSGPRTLAETTIPIFPAAQPLPNHAMAAERQVFLEQDAALAEVDLTTAVEAYGLPVDTDFAEVAAFYTEALSEQGWSPVEAPDESPDESLDRPAARFPGGGVAAWVKPASTGEGGEWLTVLLTSQPAASLDPDAQPDAPTGRVLLLQYAQGDLPNLPGR